MPDTSKLVRHEQHKCNMSDTSATRVRQEQHKDCNTSATRVIHEWHECNTSDTWTTRVRHECCTNDTSAAQVKNFDFGSDTSKNIFSYPFIYYMASERLQREEQFHSKNQLLEKLFNGKSYIKKLDSRLLLLMPLFVPA